MKRPRVERAIRSTLGAVIPDDDARKVFSSRLKRWGSENRRDFPWREASDPFRILVAEVLLQRSRGRTVAAVYGELFRRWPEPHALARARLSSITAVIRPLGLVKRAETLKALAAEVGRHGLPDTLDGLLALPGVGRYAASVTLAVGFARRAPVVDGVSARVYRRYFGLDGDGPASSDTELWQLVDRATPTTHVREWNWAVLDLAAMICLPKIPRCNECPLASHCAWSQQSLDPVTGRC